jgi:predicted TIM-barrel fold metal-dependent hydrolase
VSAPRFQVPAGATDTYMHIYDAAARRCILVENPAALYGF